MSFELLISEKEMAGAEFVVKLGKALQRALLTRKSHGKFTQQELATRLEVDRARINRCFSGNANLTAESIGEIGWALGAIPEIEFKFDDTHPGNTFIITEFDRKEQAHLNAQKVSTIGAGASGPHVWVIVQDKRKHYSIRINDQPSLEISNFVNVNQSQPPKWESSNFEY